MRHRYFVAWSGALLTVAILTGCQSQSESPRPDSDSTSRPSHSAVDGSVAQTGTMRIGSPPLNVPPSVVVPGTETNSPLPLAEVTDVAIEHLHDRSRVTYHLSGTGTVTWKVEYVSEAIRGGDNHVVDVNGSAILQVDIMGVTARQQFPPIETYGGTIAGVETALVSREIVQSFVGTAAGHPEFQVIGTESPGHIVVDVFYAPA